MSVAVPACLPGVVLGPADPAFQFLSIVRLKYVRTLDYIAVTVRAIYSLIRS